MFKVFSSVQFLGIWIFATPWNPAHQASLSITDSQSLLKLMSIKSVMTSSHHPLSSPSSLNPSQHQSLQWVNSAWGGQSIGVSASASVLPMNTQVWSALGWTGWISLQSKGLSRIYSNTTVQKHQPAITYFLICLSWPLLSPDLFSALTLHPLDMWDETDDGVLTVRQFLLFLYQPILKRLPP